MLEMNFQEVTGAILKTKMDYAKCIGRVVVSSLLSALLQEKTVV